MRTQSLYVSFLNRFDILQNFTKAELLRNMMGLLGNVAEVSELRPIFMVDYLIEEFVVLLESSSDGIEVSVYLITLLYLTPTRDLKI